jgi:hypothetical protein
MLIDAGTKREAVLCVTAINDYPNDDGTYWTEFYPVDLLLRLRHTDKLLTGHPLLDLKPETEGELTVMVENVRPAELKKICRWCRLGHFVALRLPEVRGKQSGKATFTWRKGADYLSEEDLLWLENISQTGAIVAEELQAIAAIADFFQALYKVISQKKKRPKKKKLKRKERRQKMMRAAW